MGHPLSALGILHTLVSVLAILLVLPILVTQGRVEPRAKAGKIYSGLTLVACLTALAIYRHGSFGPGHILAVLTLFCLVGAVLVEEKKIPYWMYLQTTFMSASILFSLIPGVIETLTRLPLGSPFASGAGDPLVRHSLGIVFALFVPGLGAQLWSIRKKSRQ
jgi:hypothetical protein